MNLGVEIGGTKLQVGVCDRRGRIRQLIRATVVRRNGARGILDQLERIITPLIAEHRVNAIGVGFGGPVDAPHGVVVKSYHIHGWDGFALGRWFVKRFGRPAVLENDTNAAALAEAVVGAGRGRRAVLYSNVGTGIGGGFVVDGKIHNGRFGATEIGHTRFFVRGRWRILEELSSGLSIERGKTTLAQSAKYYGMALANAISLLNPDIVVIGGGVSRAGERFLGPVRETVKRFVFGPYRRNFRIVPAALGETVVVVGAALLAGREG
ncbi:MAG TPA: ROK family protein [Verrucomicrobiae bacterium]|nr:ROK family protein [Verrucomicrobiae bacterium]